MVLSVLIDDQPPKEDRERMHFMNSFHAMMWLLSSGREYDFILMPRSADWQKFYKLTENGFREVAHWTHKTGMLEVAP